MPKLTISIRPYQNGDFDVELRQADQVITLPCYRREDALLLAADLAGTIEACTQKTGVLEVDLL